VVASHPHTDHIGNMEWVLDQYHVGLYVDDGIEYDSATYTKVDTMRRQKAARYWSTREDLVPDIDFCPREDVNARVLSPHGFGNDPNPNNNSVVVRVDYLDDSFLFVGDTEESEEQLLEGDQEVRPLLRCDFLKAGHHGSNTSSTDSFLSMVSPKVIAV